MLDIDMEFKQGILVVRLKGVLNGDTSNKLKTDLQQIVKDNGIKYVLLNLKKIEYIDKYGLNVIKQSYHEIVKNEGKLILCGINKLFDYNVNLTSNLYQINEEVTAYKIINI